MEVATMMAALYPAHVARAADSTDEQFIRRGVEARRRRDDAAALEFFKKAYAVRPTPRAAAQMGLAEIALGRWLDAEAHLDEATAAPTDAWIQKNAKILAESLARVRQNVGALEVLGSPAGAEVVIGTEVRGTLPLSKPIRVRAGDVRFEVRAPGYAAGTFGVQVLPGQLARETVSLLALPAVPPPALVTTSEPGSSGTPTLTSHPAPADQSGAASSRGRGLRITGLVLTAVGVAAAGAGLAFGLKARTASTTDSTAPTFDPSAEAAGAKYQQLQWAGYAVGGALIVGGITTYIIGASRRGASSAEVAFAPAPGGGLATVGGAF